MCPHPPPQEQRYVPRGCRPPIVGWGTTQRTRSEPSNNSREEHAASSRSMAPTMPQTTVNGQSERCTRCVGRCHQQKGKGKYAIVYVLTITALSILTHQSFVSVRPSSSPITSNDLAHDPAGLASFPTIERPRLHPPRIHSPPSRDSAILEPFGLQRVSTTPAHATQSLLLRNLPPLNATISLRNLHLTP